MTQDEYEAQIALITARWRQRADELIAAGWHPPFAFATAADEAAVNEPYGEATIQMMTFAAGRLHAAFSWPHSSAFTQWWNARYAEAPKLDGFEFRAPCFLEAGSIKAALVATWHAFNRSLHPERTQA